MHDVLHFLNIIITRVTKADGLNVRNINYKELLHEGGNAQHCGSIKESCTRK